MLPVTSPATGDEPASRVRLADCRYDDVPLDAVYDAWARTPVDTILALPATYVPPDLVPVAEAGLEGRGAIRAIVVADLRAMARAARESGVPLAVQSAYRSHARQAAVFDEWTAISGEVEARRFSARPGHSEHQLGTALDLREAGGPAPWQVDFGARPTGRWLAEHAWEFGFVVSYPPGMESVTCYGEEPWHVRYVGRDVAAAVRTSGLTLREWLWREAGG